MIKVRIPGMAEPGGLMSIGSHRVGHDRSDSAAAAAAAISPVIRHADIISSMLCYYDKASGTKGK